MDTLQIEVAQNKDAKRENEYPETFKVLSDDTAWGGGIRETEQQYAGDSDYQQLLGETSAARSEALLSIDALVGSLRETFSKYQGLVGADEQRRMVRDLKEARSLILRGCTAGEPQ